MRVSHRHLRKLIESSSDEGIDLLYNPLFCMELAYSSFIVPTFPVGEMRAIYLLDKKAIPLFTDLDEYKKSFEGNAGLTPASYDFDYILSANADLIINPSSENMFLDIDYFRGKAETPYFEYDSPFVGYNCAELELVARKIKNDSLNEFITEPSAIYDYEEFFTLLRKSILLTAISLDSTEDIVDFTDSMAPIVIRDDRFVEIFTNIGQVKRGPDTYVQVVNLAQFLEMAIRFDLEGVALNPDTDDIRIDREMILLNFEEFRKNYDSSKYMQAHNYAFRLVVESY